MTERRASRAIPAAIIAGAALIAAALYFGLRGQEPTTPVSAPPPVKVTAPRPASASPGALAQARRNVLAALDARRQELVTKCWQPSRDKDAGVPVIHWTLEYFFDAQGKMTASALREHRGATHAEVTRCFQETVTELRIPAPGAGVRLEVDFYLPNKP